MSLDGGSGGSGAGRFDDIERVVGTSRHRDFRPQHVERLSADFPRSLFGNFGKPCRSLSHDRIVEGGWVIGACHGCVEVDFREARSHIFSNHDLGLGHRRGSGLSPPGIGSEMVATEDDLGSGYPAGLGERENISGKIRRRFSGVAAKLINPGYR